MDSSVKNSRFPRLARNSGLIRHRFDFEHDTLPVAGVGFTVLVTVFSQDDFELWNLDADRPCALAHLSRKDQRAIEDKICDRYREVTGHRERMESRAEIAELNAERGVR